MQLYLTGKKGLLPLILILILLGSCRSFTNKSSEHYNPDTHYPLNFGICQVGSMWPEENGSFRSSPSAYETAVWQYYQKSPEKQNLFSEMGIQWWRSDFSWRHLEPMEDHWSFQRYDWLVEAAAEHDRKILALLVYDTPWLYDEAGQSRNITAGELDRYLNYARTIAERYGDSIGGFEIWNEPNFGRFWNGNEEDFFTLTRETIKVLKKAAPGVPVAVGALSYHPVTGGKSFLKKMIEAGALEGADAVSLHPYGASLENSAQRVSRVRTLLRENGYEHRIWITEMGFPTRGFYPHRVSLENHYTQTIKALTLMTAAGADLITWYKLFDSYDPEEPPLLVHSERSFGLMSRKYERKPGAFAYSLLVKELQGMTYNPEHPLKAEIQTPLIRAFVYEKEDRIAVVLWSRNPEKSLKIDLSGIEDATVTTWNRELMQTTEGSGTLGEYPLLITGSWSSP